MHILDYLPELNLNRELNYIALINCSNRFYMTRGVMSFIHFNMEINGVETYRCLDIDSRTCNVHQMDEEFISTMRVQSIPAITTEEGNDLGQLLLITGGHVHESTYCMDSPDSVKVRHYCVKCNTALHYHT
jgi:hypothetical protein